MYPKTRKPTRKEFLRDVAAEFNVDKENIRKLADNLNKISIYAEKTQKELSALINALKRRGIIDELLLSQERMAIEEMIRMQDMAIKIGDKPEDKIKEEKEKKDV